MMNPMNEKLNKVMEETTDKEKIRLFYEFGKYFLDSTEETEDKDMNNLFDEIANVINAIENL